MKWKRQSLAITRRYRRYVAPATDLLFLLWSDNSNAIIAPGKTNEFFTATPQGDDGYASSRRGSWDFPVEWNGLTDFEVDVPQPKQEQPSPWTESDYIFQNEPPAFSDPGQNIDPSQWKRYYPDAYPYAQCIWWINTEPFWANNTSGCYGFTKCRYFEVPPVDWVELVEYYTLPIVWAVDLDLLSGIVPVLYSLKELGQNLLP